MANEYFDCITFRERRNGKKAPVRIGYAKPRDDGGFNVYLDALPLDGHIAILPQREKDGPA